MPKRKDELERRRWLNRGRCPEHNDAVIRVGHFGFDWEAGGHIEGRVCCPRPGCTGHGVMNSEGKIVTWNDHEEPNGTQH